MDNIMSKLDENDQILSSNNSDIRLIVEQLWLRIEQKCEEILRLNEMKHNNDIDRSINDIKYEYQTALDTKTKQVCIQINLNLSQWFRIYSRIIFLFEG